MWEPEEVSRVGRVVEQSPLGERRDFAGSRVVKTPSFPWVMGEDSRVWPVKELQVSCRTADPSLLGTRDCFHRRQFFHRLGIGDGLGMIEARYIYCALYFYYYCISSTSDHWALDPGVWGPLVLGTDNWGGWGQSCSPRALHIVDPAASH